MKCRFCGSIKNLQVSCTKGKYRYYQCRDCNTIRMQDYRKTNKGKLAIKKAVAKYEAKNPERRKAWVKAHTIKFQSCKVCGINNNIHRHHPDIKQPFKIIFLCALHHKQAESRRAIMTAV